MSSALAVMVAFECSRHLIQICALRRVWTSSGFSKPRSGNIREIYMKHSKSPKDLEFDKLIANWKPPTAEDIERVNKLAAPILAELHERGVDAKDLHHIETSISPEIVDFLMRHLTRMSNDGLPNSPGKHSWENMQVQDGIIRSLCMASEPFDGRPLVQCFENTDHVLLRFAILNTIDCIHPHSIDDWLEDILQKPEGQPLRDFKFRIKKSK